MLNGQPPWLAQLALDASDYIHTLFSVSLRLKPSAAGERLPYFLSDQYRFLEGELFDRDLLFMAERPRRDDGNRENTPANIARHWRQVEREFPNFLVVYLAPALSSFNRKRLLDQRTPFLIPRNQLFIPRMLVDLRENFRSERDVTSSERLTPAAQCLVLAQLLKRDSDDATPSAMARELNYSAMSMGRAFDELALTDLVEVREVGKERRLMWRASGSRLWDKALPRLQSPVRKIRAVRQTSASLPGLIAGETALAHYSMLAEPTTPTTAIAAADWADAAKDLQLVEAHPADERQFLVETWAYDPAALSDSDIVDRLSLYLSVRDHADERVVQAAEQMLRDVEW